jgi:surface polysaccharide O-acyltransferase-like enzyme
MKENKFLYAARFIACLAVIAIHTRFPGKFGQVVDALARFAVPYFFAVSGRFLLNSSDDTTEYIRSRTKRALIRLLKITGFIYLVHLVFSFIVNVLVNKMQPLEWLSFKYNLGELVNFIMYNSGRFIYDGSYTFDHIWFLFALIYVYVLIYIFAGVLRKWYKGLIAILLFFLYLGMLLQTYYPIRPFGINICTWFVMRNWLFMGIPFVLIGILFADYIRDKVDVLDSEKKKSWQKSTKVKAIAGLVAGIVLTAVEIEIYGNKEVHFGSLLIVFSLLFLSECDIQGGRFAWKIGKRASSNIYYYHVLLIAVIDLCSQNGIIPVPAMWLKPLLVMAICVILFYLVPVLAEKWLKMPSST